MFSPIRTLFMYFPFTFFFRVILLLIINGVTIFIVKRKYKKQQFNKTKSVGIILLVAYTTVVLFFTVLGRRTLEYYRFGTDAISYYTNLFSGQGETDFIELWLNILMFVPIGVLGCFIFEKCKVLWTGITGFCISIFIELLQLLLRSGFVSLTDIIHNTIGTLIGSIFTIIIILIVNNIRKRLKSRVKVDDAN